MRVTLDARWLKAELLGLRRRRVWIQAQSSSQDAVERSSINRVTSQQLPQVDRRLRTALFGDRAAARPIE